MIKVQLYRSYYIAISPIGALIEDVEPPPTFVSVATQKDSCNDVDPLDVPSHQNRCCVVSLHFEKDRFGNRSVLRERVSNLSMPSYELPFVCLWSFRGDRLPTQYAPLEYAGVPGPDGGADLFPSGARATNPWGFRMEKAAKHIVRWRGGSLIVQTSTEQYPAL